MTLAEMRAPPELSGTPHCHATEMVMVISCHACEGSEEFLKGDIRIAKDLDGLGCLGDMGWCAATS